MTFKKFYVSDAYINTTIYDDSAVTVTDSILPKRLTILQPIFASKGKANVIMDFDSSNTVLETYGNDLQNYNKYGQAGMNLIHAMSGGASAQVCRLLPDNATTAALMSKVILRTASKGETITYLDDNGINQEKELMENSLISKVVFEKASAGKGGSLVKKTVTPAEVERTLVNPAVEEHQVTDVGGEDIRGVHYDQNETVPAMEAEYEEKVTRPAYTTYEIPLFKLVYNGAGKCGNRIGVSIENDYERDDATTDGRRYKMSLYELDDNGNASKFGDSFYFSLNPDALLVQGSEVYENLQYVYGKKDSAGNERAVLCEPYIMDNFETLNNIVANFCNTDQSSINIDILNCTDKNGDRYADEIVTTDNGEQTVESVKYNKFFLDPSTDAVGSDAIYYLQGGSDGDLEVGYTYESVVGGEKVSYTVTEEKAKATKEALLVSFFRGQVDPALFDERMIASDIVFDADYSFDKVKPVLLGKFREIRPDIFVVADIGTEARNCTQAMSLAKALYGMVDGSAGYTAAVIVHAGYTTDRAMNYHVTGTYDYSYGMARAYGLLGTFSVFAGYQNAKVQTMEYDWLPYKDEFDTMLTPLRKLGCIFAFKIDRAGTVAYMSEDNMYTQTTSRLKSIRAGMIIGDAVRLAKSILIKYVYDNEGAAGAIRKASSELAEQISGRYPTNVTVTSDLYQSDRDKMLDTTTCDLTFYFPGMTKGWTLNIYAKRGE